MLEHTLSACTCYRLYLTRARPIWQLECELALLNIVLLQIRSQSN